MKKLLPLAALLPFAAYGDISSGIITWHKFEQVEGTSFSGELVNDEPATVTGNFQVVSGVDGNAVQLQGAGDTLERKIAGGKDFPQFTASFWMKQVYENGLTNYTTIGSAWNRFQFIVSGDNVKVVIASNVVIDLTPEQLLQPVDQWNLWTTSFDGSTLTLYQNGVQIARQTGVTPYSDPWWNIKAQFGKNLTDGSLVKGSLDELRLYDRALTPLESWQLFDSPAQDYPGQITVELPPSPAAAVDNIPVTGSLFHFASQVRIPFSGSWGESLMLDNLPDGKYQLTLDTVAGYVPRMLPKVLELSAATPSVVQGVLYRDPIAVEQLSPLPGVEVELYSQGLFQPRQMVMGNNVLYVGSSAIPLDSEGLSGLIYAIPLDPQTGAPGEAYVVASGLEEPHGVAYRDGDLYFSTVGALYKISDIDSNYRKLATPEKIYTYPADEGTVLGGSFRYWHQKHPLRFNPYDVNDKALYTAVGRPCNVCVMEDQRYGTILRLDLETLQTTTVAEGIRNSVGFDWHPVTGEIWFSDNNRQGFDNPDEINRVTSWGQHFGAPYVFGKDIIGITEGEYNGTEEAAVPAGGVLSDIAPADINVANYRAPAFELEPFSAPLGVMFWDGYPAAEGQQQLLFATHATGLKRLRPGLELRMLTLDNSGAVVSEQPLVHGWMQNIDEVQSYACLTDACIGRPVEMLRLADGSFLLSDDKAGVIYRVSYQTPASNSTLTINVPAKPDASLTDELLAGRLIDANGVERRFYINWNESKFQFAGLPDGEYTVVMNSLPGWQPDQSSYSLSISAANPNPVLNWQYQPEVLSGALMIKLPTKPAGYSDSELPRVTVIGAETQTLELAWGETSQLALSYGQYQLEFSYLWGGLPTPATQVVNISEAAPQIVVDLDYLITADLGKRIADGQCSACHGSQAAGLVTQEIANRWIGSGFDALVAKIDGMPLHCDSNCAEQVGRYLWSERWAQFGSPELPAPRQPNTQGGADQAQISSTQVSGQFVNLEWAFEGGSTIPGSVKRQFIEFRYLQPMMSEWQATADLVTTSASVKMQYGGDIELRVVTLDSEGSTTYSESTKVHLADLGWWKMSSHDLYIHWTFDELTPGRAIDQAGNGLDLRLSDTAYVDGGVAGYALQPNGNSAAELLLDATQAIDMAKTDFTINFWLKTVQASDLDGRYKLFPYASGDFYIKSQGEFNLQFATGNNSSNKINTAANSLPANRWVMATYTRDVSGNAAVYLDGELHQQAQHGASAPIDRFLLAKFDGGLLDEVRIYKRVLSADEVMTLYRNPTAGAVADSGTEIDAGNMSGEELWSTFKCATCHGADGLGSTPILESLYRADIIDLIRETMPYGNPGSCDQACAEKLYDWMYQELIVNGANPPSSPASISLLDATISDDYAPELLHKAALNLASRLPTPQERLQLQAEGAGVLPELLGQMLEEPAFAERMTEIYHDILHTKVLTGVLNGTNKFSEIVGGTSNWFKIDYVAGSDESNHAWTESVAAHRRETTELVRYLVANNRPFSELLTADYTMVNYFNARSYGVASQLNFRQLAEPEVAEFPWDPEDYQPVKLPIPQAGVMTNPVYMSIFPTTPTNLNRHRSYKFYKNFLDTDILAMAGERPSADDLSGDEPTLTNPACTGCHLVMDPVASSFQHWNKNYYDAEYKWPNNKILAAGFNGEVAPLSGVDPLQWLAQQAVQDSRFARSVVKILFEPITGFPLLEQPLTTASDNDKSRYASQQQDINTLASRFRATNYQVKPLVKDLLLSGYAKRDNALGGTKHLLSPEALDRKIRALFGREWDSGQTDWLDDIAIRLMYGGIDHTSVMTRNPVLSGTGAAVQSWMAVDLACEVTPRQWSRANDDRLIAMGLEPEGVGVRVTPQEFVFTNGALKLDANATKTYGGDYVFDFAAEDDQEFTAPLIITQAGNYELVLPAANARVNPVYFQLEIDDLLVADDIELLPTGSWSTWRLAQSSSFYLSPGSYQLRFKGKGFSDATIDSLFLRNIDQTESVMRNALREMFYAFYGELLAVDDEQITRAMNFYQRVLQRGEQGIIGEGFGRAVDSACNPANLAISGVEYPHLTKNDHFFYIRAWQATVSYLLKDIRFFYH
ncbi:LamG-like jellyroll fold domain-containing protein [Shewanella halotolerans]|uniref:LamG-like jellyroll fold domain-containing protein n=1 Tax=Shewanella halotolerans TaxID=2864204 RepID=UPI001C655745|nr:LamG-like jellyroll fold domain-containing protein [Shewanella halotolerans]QYJ89855.1 DUF1592 domain-containing protein [Shewanella halotolerans]